MSLAALAPLAELPNVAAAPPVPRSLQDTGLAIDQIERLLIKTLYSGEATGLSIADRIRLPFTMIEPLIERARTEQLIEVRGSTGSGASSYRYALTDLGRDRARQYLDASQYVGPAPVPLAAYVAQMKVLAAGRQFIDRERLRQGFSHLIISDHVLEQLGPAVNAGKAVFLYGPPGNGKTVIAEGLGRALGGDMYIPWALDIDGQVITIFDPVNHEKLEDETTGSILIKAADRDRRWVRVKRPVVTVGGELTLEMLDLSFNPIAKFYEAPLQMKANGGVFVVDDFGRQRIRPRDLLNRWIVPLESRVDYLTLHTGKKFEMPFDVLIVFATNLNPESLADEAFLRRIPYKIYAKNPTHDEFGRIFELNCKRRGIGYDPVIIEYLVRRYYEPRGLEMRGCHPRDIVEQVVDICRYQAKPLVITRELLDQACKNYFLEEQKGRPGSGARRPMAVMKGGQRPAVAPPDEKPAGKGEEWLS